MITNVNEGLCHRRVQECEPAFFVNWQEGDKQNYFFHHLRYVVHNKYKELLKYGAKSI